MNGTDSRLPLALRIGAATVICLLGGMALGVAIGTAVHGALPGHMMDPVRVAPAALLALLGVVGGGAAWGVAVGRLTGDDRLRRLARVGGLSYGPTFVLVGLLLTVAEVLIVVQGRGPQMALDTLFTVLFVPASAVVAGVPAWALGRQLADGATGARLGLGVGAAAGVTFLLVNRLMHGLGWVVGGPGAAERFTMLTVLGVGALAAAVVGGATLGLLLANRPIPALSHPVA